MRSKQYAKAYKREIQKPVHGDNLPGHAEQGRSFDVESRANLRNLREILSSTRQTLKSFQMYKSTSMAAQGAP
jgi:hypothetical protein